MSRAAVDPQRLWDSLLRLAQVGAYEDEATGLTGVNRQSLTDADVEARRLLVGWMRDDGRLRATVGRLETFPGLPSVVPERAEFTVDLRNPDDALMAVAERDLAAFLDQRGLQVEAVRMAKTAAVPFSDEVQETIVRAADGLGLPITRLTSGAGHDAQEVAAIAPTAMIFVRGQSDGISHNPREYSTPEDCAAGVSVLAQTVLELAS